MINRVIKVLVIDDRQDNLVILKALIKEAFPDAEVFQALSGMQGLEMAIQEEPDVILLDIVMPGIDGFEVCRKLKADEELREIPVVFVTAIKVDKESRIRALECGAEAFLAKPIDATELTAQIRAMVKIREISVRKSAEKKRLADLVHDKTKELTKEIKAREESERALLEAQRLAHIGSYVFDKQTNRVKCTQEALEICGIKQEDFTGSPDEIIQAIHAEDREYAIEQIKKAGLEKAVAEYECRIVRRDGEVRFVSVRSVPIYDKKVGHIRTIGTIQDISARKQAELAVKESEEKFKYIFDNSAVGNSLTWPSGEIQVNNTMCEMLGYSKKELEGKLWEHITYPDDIEGSRSEINQLREGKRTVARFSKRYIKKDGSVLWADVHTSIRKESHGKPLYFMTSIIDITKRKRAQEALRQSEERYKGLFEYSGLGIGYYTPDGIVISYNKKAIKNSGRDFEEIIGKSIFELFSKEDADIYLSRINQAVSSNEQQEYEDCIPSLSGLKCFSSTYSRVVTADGTIAGVQIASLDITERKQAEVALAESEQRYRLLYTSMDQGLAVHEIITDAAGKPVDYTFIDINESYTRLFGFTREMCIGKRITDMMPKVEQHAIEIFGDVALTGEPGYYENYLETSGKFYSTYSYSPQKRQFAVLVTDITEKKQQQEQLIYLSYHDQLTGLFNRRYFEAELDRLDNDENLPLTIVMADINGLKLINDSFGHHVGDQYLVKAATLIKDECRANDTVARLGGDEFVLILPKFETSQAEQLIHRLQSRLVNEKMDHTVLSISFGFDTKNCKAESIREIHTNAENHMYRHKVHEHASMRSRTVDVIMNALFEKSNRELLHSERVSRYCESLAIEMHLDSDAVSQIKTAGLVHDIGKIGIEESVLNKRGGLNEREWKEIKKHPESGWRILVSAKEFSELADFVLQHHERWDGTGYPKGLRGEEISIEARIISIADAYDAMTHERSYRYGISTQEAIDEITRYSGTQFDPGIARVFIESVLGGKAQPKKMDI